MKNLLKKKLVVTKAHADIAFSGVCIVLTLYMLLFGIEQFTSVGFGAVGIVNDRLFPRILMVVGLICSCAILIFALADNRRNKKIIEEGGTPLTTEFSICALVIAVVGLLFYFTMKVIGYPLCNFICIYAVYYMLGGRKIWKGVAVAGIFTLACYLFFAVYLGVNLPLGFGL